MDDGDEGRYLTQNNIHKTVVQYLCTWITYYISIYVLLTRSAKDKTENPSGQNFEGIRYSKGHLSFCLFCVCLDAAKLRYSTHLKL